MFNRRIDVAGVENIEWSCPGCGCMHTIPVSGPYAWGFNGDWARPTLTPSVLERGEGFIEDDVYVVAPYRCHFYLIAGMIEFLEDCTHKLRGTKWVGK